jgi:hypothetical protein
MAAGGAAGRRRWTLLLGAACSGLAAPPAYAGEMPHCAAIEAGALNVQLGPAARTAERAVMLKAGDTLSFMVHGADSASLALRAGDGPWQTLVADKASARSAFVAPGEGVLTLRFAARGGRRAALTVGCIPAAVADGAGLRTGDPVAAEATLEVPKAAPAEMPPAAEAAPEAVPPRATGLALKLEKREPDVAASGLDLGVSYKVWPSLMVGALAQFDQSTAHLAGLPLSFSDRAWMAGPTTTVQVAPGVALDMRAAWGAAEMGATDADPNAASAERRLLSARLANTQAFGALKLTPSISLNHMRETLHAAVPSPAEAALAQAIAAGRVDIGPELVYRFDLAPSVFVEPKAAFGGFWSFDSLSKLVPGAAAHADMRLKAEAGVTFGVTDGAKVQAGAAVEEGERASPDVWTGRLQLSIPLK